MNTLLTQSNIIFILGLLGVMFTVYKYFRDPQIISDKKQLILDTEIDSKASILAQKELENKANVLAEQVKGRNEENERRFLDMGNRLDLAMTTAQNHIHTVDVKVDNLITTVNIMSNEITRLATIIDERIPKK